MPTAVDDYLARIERQKADAARVKALMEARAVHKSVDKLVSVHKAVDIPIIVPCAECGRLRAQLQEMERLVKESTGVVRDAAYWREQKRKQRAKVKSNG